MAEIVDQLSFDDRKATGGWNQGFDISYTMDDFKEQQLQVIVMPHSHNDPGEGGGCVCVCVGGGG